MSRHEKFLVGLDHRPCVTYGAILAAGFGSRLGHDMPKALISWGDGALIDMQLAHFASAGIDDVWVVVGFQKERVIAHVEQNWPKVRFVENDRFMDTQTGKSLLVALEAIPPDGDVVMTNGDVVFDAPILDRLLEDRGSALACEPKATGDEEVKYRVREGRLQAISKDVHGEGEAVGINRIAQADRDLMVKALRYADDGTIFEHAIEWMLPYTQEPVRVVDIKPYRAIEVDFPEDLEAAHEMFP